MKKPRVASHVTSNYVPGARYRGLQGKVVDWTSRPGADETRQQDDRGEDSDGTRSHPCMDIADSALL
jgi:hypothetical protein